MSLKIKKVSLTKYKELVKNIRLPLWVNPLYIDCYRKKIILVAEDRSKVKGVFVVPLHINDNQLLGERSYRFFPYAAPHIFETNNLKRKKIILNFFKYIQTKVEGLSLPLSPDFKDIASIQSLGTFIECRHTHIFDKKINIITTENRLKNHFNHANKYIEVSFTNNPKIFSFDVAIKGSLEERKQRSKLAKKLLKNKDATIISATEKGKLVAGILLAHDDENVYMLHSWQLSETRRGTITLLIIKAIEWTFENNFKKFDFEGSVIQNIDHFFCGFNAKITPYGHIHWNSKKDLLYKQISETINIPGRVTTNENLS